MNRDLILGATASLVVHFATLFGHLDLKAAPKNQPAEKPTIYIFEAPRIEPDDPEKPRDEPDEPRLNFVPPRQIDTPSIVTDTTITQVLQPPPPDSSKLNAGALDTIDAHITARPTGRVFEPGLLDQAPQPRYRTPPPYPFEMRRTGVEGEVLVDFLVDPEGNVVNARPVASTHRDFELAAVQAVSKWKFRPGRKDGQAVITHMQVPIVFSLDQK